ncbi:DUF4367 domain-containing protein [Brevibacillus ruminantium]|uniref:DUF4367 domain-containing protein n=1 Tax=Brevibacillus ruminantium TaxID=2950604 RepID=A0ABY4WLP2_9BACL|nr:DUF4367 domain-containing protein [Brevibacillus ruminantium]USG65561.1 DUF4367 domain-containing protein [Brevibacillus ruminantium]
MVQNNTDKWLEELFQSTAVPPSDVKQRVMKVIEKKETKEEDVKVKKKLGFFLAIGLLVGGSSAFAALHTIQLHDEKGEVVYEVGPSNAVDVPAEYEDLFKQIQEENQRKNNIVNAHRETMKPGSAAAIYFVPKRAPEGEVKMAGNPNRPHPDLTLVTNGFSYTAAQDLQKKLGDQVKVPADLAGGLRFQEGGVDYFAKNDVDLELLRKEAEQTKKDYVIKEIELSDKLNEVYMSYKGEKGKILVIVKNLEWIEGPIRGGTLDGTKVEKVIIGGMEAVYGETNSPDGFHLKNIEWMNSGSKLSYDLTTRSKEISKEDFIKIAESYVTAK